MEYGQKVIKFRANFLINGEKFSNRAGNIVFDRHRHLPWGHLKSNSRVPLPEMFKPKTIKWSEAKEARPPLHPDLDGPGPTRYYPRNKPLWETNAPSYSFGRGPVYRETCGRPFLQNLWCQYEDQSIKKTNFEIELPSPFHYDQPSTLGPNQVTKAEYPSYTIGKRDDINLFHRGSFSTKPAPNWYDPTLSDHLVFQSSPVHSISYRSPGTMPWAHHDSNPGPAAYNVDKAFRATRRRYPMYSVCGTRREKQHYVGPFMSI
nr:PREDICTED: uncharacterized protein C9orf173 homolog isoform X2 [Latimeria chalumnae]|eukprot:XP_014342984.1 PREDICTED: uncharacterized protein C9orf173 homolog isoform X2 [Latimeria chalumnae]